MTDHLKLAAEFINNYPLPDHWDGEKYDTWTLETCVEQEANLAALLKRVEGDAVGVALDIIAYVTAKPGADFIEVAEALDLPFATVGPIVQEAMSKGVLEQHFEGVNHED